MGTFDRIICDGQDALNQPNAHVDQAFADILNKHLAAMTAHDQEEDE